MKLREFIDLPSLSEPEKTENEADQTTQKIVQLAKIMNKKDEMPKLKKAVKKALAGMPLTEEDRTYIKEILQLLFKPDIARFVKLVKRF